VGASVEESRQGRRPQRRGWVFLRWDEEVALEPIPAAARVQRIGQLRGWHRRGVTGPASLLELAALPAWELRRPRDWDVVPEVVALIGRIVGASGQPSLLNEQSALEGRHRARPLAP
jgi:hypothetical protein